MLSRTITVRKCLERRSVQHYPSSPVSSSLSTSRNVRVFIHDFTAVYSSNSTRKLTSAPAYRFWRVWRRFSVVFALLCPDKQRSDNERIKSITKKETDLTCRHSSNENSSRGSIELDEMGGIWPELSISLLSESLGHSYLTVCKWSVMRFSLCSRLVDRLLESVAREKELNKLSKEITAADELLLISIGPTNCPKNYAPQVSLPFPFGPFSSPREGGSNLQLPISSSREECCFYVMTELGTAGFWSQRSILSYILIVSLSFPWWL